MQIGIGLGIPATHGNIAGFTPLELSPTLWLDASDTSTITEVGGAVSQWDDKSGNGYDVSQATAAYQPTTGSTLNGLNVIEFATDYLAAASAADWKFLSDGSTTHSFVVCDVNAGADGGLHVVFSTGAAVSPTLTSYSVFWRDTGGVNVDVVANAVTDGVAGTISVTNYTAINTLPLSTPSIIHTRCDPDNATAADRSVISVNQGTDQKNNVGTAAPSSANPSQPLGIGYSAGSPNYWYGKIAEVIIFDRDLTADQINATEQYLADKWGITL